MKDKAYCRQLKIQLYLGGGLSGPAFRTNAFRREKGQYMPLVSLPCPKSQTKKEKTPQQ